eukprot:scaffold302466_cov17-Tisochrysis_lutea.AAC.1
MALCVAAASAATPLQPSFFQPFSAGDMQEGQGVGVEVLEREVMPGPQPPSRRPMPRAGQQLLWWLLLRLRLLL